MEKITKSLDLGSGPNLDNPFATDEAYGVDYRPTDNPNIMQADIVVEGIPFDDNEFDIVTAFDFVEHVPRVIYIDGQQRNPFIELMVEIHRVLKPGGLFYARTPAYPHPEAFQDPTHVNIITENTVFYFTGNYDQYMPVEFVDKFEFKAEYWDGPWLVWELNKK